MKDKNVTKETQIVANEENYAIEVKGLKIRYRTLNKMSIKNSLFSFRKAKVDMFEAVKGIDFKVPMGEIVGLIGKNGSGKSTTLRAIAGIFSPDEGIIDLHGHSVALLSIGVGFNKKLTGRENIRLSGLLLGFTEEEIKAKEKEIIEFSELGKFIDKPVKTYSSGMHSKLAFSITAVLDSEIMLIDEVFSVGDAKFKKKSYRKMKELISHKDRTVVIVSHNMNTIESLCDSVIWLNDGEIMMQGPTKEVLEKYNEFMA